MTLGGCLSSCLCCCRTKDKAKAKSCKCHSCIGDFPPVLTTSGDMLIFCHLKKCWKAAGSSSCFPCWELTGVLIVKLYCFILILIHERKTYKWRFILCPGIIQFQYWVLWFWAGWIWLRGTLWFCIPFLKSLLFYFWEDDCTKTFLFALWWIILLSGGSWQISKEIPKLSSLLCSPTSLLLFPLLSLSDKKGYFKDAPS